MLQRTIAEPTEVVGIGLHKGDSVRLRIEPLDADSGIIFYRSELGRSIPLSPEAVIDTRMATVIGTPEGYISTIEHFLSALYAHGIDNLRVVLEGNEMPIMDGSAVSFCLLIQEAGIRSLERPKPFLKIKRPVEVRDGDKFARLEPSDRIEFDFTIDFPHPAIGRQRLYFDFTLANYMEEIARARTFGFARDIQYLQSQNLALGASLQNAIGLDEHKVLNPEGLRYPDEFVRHKILDAMGDMMVTGHNLLGRYTAFAGSHDLNHKLTLKLLADAQNYEIVALEQIRSPHYERCFA
ncbi:UDP-3-O-acyl-N-acetylglucosamine deacetylase [Nitratifractor salsuginis]|uniref:UDP-3-O-acyl-N-acetylglucosamine deacetylase n=1 Tax=Nitratifractor salsuginis (strain DSM 16511 / JCM 12458 / E9I37-1) TaxID=749222 RepID=E6X276_NITSE|nr:UDP-3-O-acyl-N-acetylglucosamine deacetylase [Nitratifractor salsuginis]ADV47145.1 UDP-3-O-(3-hydroxymyristoyl) N-acetylglucosamine deacetylase [Nitratifractor salsuginis DSM 16511]